MTAAKRREGKKKGERNRLSLLPLNVLKEIKALKERFSVCCSSPTPGHSFESSDSDTDREPGIDPRNVKLFGHAKASGVAGFFIRGGTFVVYCQRTPSVRKNKAWRLKSKRCDNMRNSASGGLGDRVIWFDCVWQTQTVSTGRVAEGTREHKVRLKNLKKQEQCIFSKLPHLSVSVKCLQLNDLLITLLPPLWKLLLFFLLISRKRSVYKMHQRCNKKPWKISSAVAALLKLRVKIQIDAQACCWWVPLWRGYEIF